MVWISLWLVSWWSAMLLPENDQPNYCNIYGTIYETGDPYEAHFKVYEEGSEAFARIIIFEEENRLYATKPGHWSFVENRDLADFIVYFTEESRDAEFSVYFTSFESFAGCQ
ncbi:MAG: DUF6150 family protein [Cyclobacteriaceae bacterium]